MPVRALSIASTTIESLFTLSATSALYRVYVLANRNNIGFNLAAIPEDYDPGFEVTDFDPEGMKRLFEYGYNRAKNGYDWLKAPPFLDPDEVFASQ